LIKNTIDLLILENIHSILTKIISVETYLIIC
jgi:hypothetical protein